MVEKRKIIKVKPSCIMQIANSYGCTRQAVYDALGKRSHSEMARKIRKEAVELYGGVEVQQVYF